MWIVAEDEGKNNVAIIEKTTVYLFSFTERKTIDIFTIFVLR